MRLPLVSAPYLPVATPDRAREQVNRGVGLITAIMFALLASTAASATSRDPQADAALMLQSAADQVKRCYRAPRVGHSGRQIVTTLRVRLTDAGFPDGLPTIISQHHVSSENRLFAGKMAQAAIQAVLRCAPLQLPGELHERGWSEFHLTFSPVAAA